MTLPSGPRTGSFRHQTRTHSHSLCHGFHHSYGLGTGSIGAGIDLAANVDRSELSLHFPLGVACTCTTDHDTSLSNRVVSHTFSVPQRFVMLTDNGSFITLIQSCLQEIWYQMVDLKLNTKVWRLLGDLLDDYSACSFKSKRTCLIWLDA